MRCFQSWLLGNFITFCGIQFLYAQTTLPYLTDFESSEGYSLGDLNAQNGWVRNQGQATINSGTAFSGDNFVALVANNPFSQISILFNSMGGDEINFVDFYLKPKAGDILNIEELVDSEGALISFIKAGSEGEVYVFNGDGAGGGEWLTTNTNNSLTIDDISQNWLHLTVRHEFNKKIWDLYVDGTIQAINLGLIDDAATYLNEFVFMGDLIADVNIDLFSLTTTNPLFIDADNDGIDDAYENIYGLNISLSDRDLDPDGDGLSNIEEFLYSTFADNPDSDEDSVSDGDEIHLNRDPLQFDSVIIQADSDLVELVTDDSHSSDITSQGVVTNTGNAVVHAVVSGDQGELKSVVMSGKGTVEIDLLNEPASTIAFYSFVFTPSVSENPADLTMLNVAGAVTAYPWYDNLDNVTSGHIKAKSGVSGLDWISSGIYYGLKEFGGSKVPLHFTLRLDEEQGVWDLFIQEKLWIADIHYIPGDDKIIITSGSEFPTTLRELIITESNPLFEDINKDGLPDSFEIEQGYSPTANNRHALMPGGTMTLLDYYLNSM